MIVALALSLFVASALAIVLGLAATATAREAREARADAESWRRGAREWRQIANAERAARQKADRKRRFAEFVAQLAIAGFHVEVLEAGDELARTRKAVH